MRLAYVLLSPTWGMHQYTADLANRMAGAGHEVHLVSTLGLPEDRYSPAVCIHRPFETRDRGFSPGGLAATQAAVRGALLALREIRPDAAHITGAHLGNPLLLRALRRDGVPGIHTLHDLHPHAGSSYGRLLYAWNRWVRREADHLLVHGECWSRELIAAGYPASRLTRTPLTHLFVSHRAQAALEERPPSVSYGSFALFIGRMEGYKGLDVLADAATLVPDPNITVTIAGPGRLDGRVRLPLSPNVDLRSRLIDDDEAVDLFTRCGVVVLPYVEASQSALVAAAYFFRKPVIVTRVGALPEYVVEGQTGWVVPPGSAAALAAALAEALSDPARLERMGQAGREWYEREQTAETETLLRMYETLAAQKEPSAALPGGSE
jgi:glycosyltransferase involved in cell wall biosynthesis